MTQFKVKCINNNNATRRLTIGKIYTTNILSKTCIVVIDNDGLLTGWCAERFELVK